MIKNISKSFSVISIGEIGDYDKNLHGYYLVEFRYSPYNFQENMSIYGQVLESFEIFENVIYFIPDIEHSILYVNPSYGNI